MHRPAVGWVALKTLLVQEFKDDHNDLMDYKRHDTIENHKVPGKFGSHEDDVFSHLLVSYSESSK